MDHFVITIGRAYGSGGLDIGRMLSERLNIHCYDEELLKLAAKESGFCEEIIQNHDERPTSSFLYSLVMDTHFANGFSSTSYLDMPLNHKIFLAQFDAIKNLAAKESCIMVGRCADYALEDYPRCLKVFIHAEINFRIRHVMDRFNLDEDKARDMIAKMDKKRASYYNYYSNKRWGDARSYHLTLDSSKLGLEGCTEMILKTLEICKSYFS